MSSQKGKDAEKQDQYQSSLQALLMTEWRPTGWELTQLCDEQLACVLAADRIGHIDVRSLPPLAVGEYPQDPDQ